VGEPLDVENKLTGDECPLSEGDVLQVTIPPGPEDKTASLVVRASKGIKECAKTATVTVSLNDLQEMQNHMRDSIDRGMEELQQKQGTGGLPAAPPAFQKSSRSHWKAPSAAKAAQTRELLRHG
jgi:hypothetical protein